MEMGSGLGRILVFESIFPFTFSDFSGGSQCLYFVPGFLKPLSVFHTHLTLICTFFFFLTEFTSHL